MGIIVMADFMVVVCGLTGALTGVVGRRVRGWFPGGEEEPEPAPQPEQAVRVPSWARP